MKRTQGLVIIVVLIVAIFSFAFFNFIGGAGQQSAGSVLTPTPLFPTIGPPTPDSRPTQTPLPPPAFTPFGTPLPTPELGPSPTPQPTIPVQRPVALSPIVKNWVTRQDPSGFTFIYPEGWDILEPTVVRLPGFTEPQVTIVMANFSFQKPVGGGEIPPGGIKIDIYDPQLPPPPGGTSLMIGPQQLSGQKFVVTRAEAPDLVQNLDRVISIHFAAGKRRWVIRGYFSLPTDIVTQNVAIFDKIVGSLRYETK